MVKSTCGENVPNFKYSTSTGTSTGTSSNVFQILQLKQYQENHPDSLQNESRTSHTDTTSMTSTTGQPTPSRTCRSTTVNERMTGTLIHNTNVSQLTTSFRTTIPSRDMTGRTNTFRTTPNTRQQVPVPQDTSRNRHPECYMHVHQPTSQVCKPDHKPARHAPRKVPVHLETAFKEEIDSLVKQGILEEVKEHTDWVNSYVIVEKDTGNHHSPNHTVKKKLRICLDPRDLNEALEREPYHTRSVDEITAKLQGMTVFTIVDFKKGYWMVVLHPDPRRLTCMALPFGRFQWTHLPMGTVVAQDIFQSKLDAIFIGMEGVTGIADDMIIAGRDEMEHNRNFLAFMEKCMENNLTLSSEKIQFKQLQVSFYGHVWSEHGISPDPKKIQALKHLEFPPDKETMRSFLGMINYLNRYSALSAHLAAPLSAVTHR